MRKLLISMTILSTVVAAAPAAAQYGYGRSDDRYGYNYGDSGERQIERELQRLHDRIDRSAERGSLSRSEAIRLQRQFDDVENRFFGYRRNGLSRFEYDDLQRRIDGLSYRFREERRDGRWSDRRDRDWDRGW